MILAKPGENNAKSAMQINNGCLPTEWRARLKENTKFDWQFELWGAERCRARSGGDLLAPHLVHLVHLVYFAHLDSFEALIWLRLLSLAHFAKLARGPEKMAVGRPKTMNAAVMCPDHNVRQCLPIAQRSDWKRAKKVQLGNSETHQTLKTPKTLKVPKSDPEVLKDQTPAMHRAIERSLSFYKLSRLRIGVNSSELYERDANRRAGQQIQGLNRV